MLPVPLRNYFCDLLPPEILEPRRGQFGVADGVLDVTVAQVGLQGARIVALVGQRVAAGVSEHVRMRLETQLGLRACTLDHAGEAGRGKWGATFRGEHEGGLGLLLALKPPQGP